MLTAGRKLRRAADFAALHGAVDDEIGGIKRIGALTVYDIAHRIGAHFKEITRACVSARRHEDWRACVRYQR